MPFSPFSSSDAEEQPFCFCARRIFSSNSSFAFSSSATVGFTEDSKVQPAPVTVHCDVGVRWLPSSRGYLYCLSADAKWLDVEQATFCAILQSMSAAASSRLSLYVEQAL